MACVFALCGENIGQDLQCTLPFLDVKTVGPLWNDFILPKGTRDLIKLMDSGEIQLEEAELVSLLADSRMSDGVAEQVLLIFSKPISVE